MNANWNYPTAIRVGSDRLSEIGDCCLSLNMGNPLLITDPGIKDFPFIKEAVDSCKASGLDCDVFSDVQPNPTGTNIEQGVTAFNSGRHDGVIAIGGGSALDAGKAIALMARQGISIWELEDIGDNWTRADVAGIAPIVAVPTTAGTGSEVGRASVILDEAERVKKIIFHPKMVPAIVILDPMVTTGLPPMLTAATGMDALSHSLEAWCSPAYHPMAEGIAVEGMRLVREYLPAAVASGSDVEARTQMLVASMMGATAFQRGLGAMHALAHPLGALYNAHHGTLNAVLMPYVLIANRQAIEPRIIRLAKSIDIPNASFDSFLDWVLELRETVSIPQNLEDLGIDDSQADLIGKMAEVDPSSGTNPILFDASQYQSVFMNALNGNLS
ncbi:MAG: iron-containing alcohol dehydrogenase [Candidatus Thioglobus sp.]|nr:MAG: iron-containing alcohol dehydrogenase [Candidatus Thioglobus sp.]